MARYAEDKRKAELREKLFSINLFCLLILIVIIRIGLSLTPLSQ